jgi:hypothetical protein
VWSRTFTENDFVRFWSAPLVSVVTSQAIAAVDALSYVVRTAFDKDKGSVNVQFHFDEKDEDTNDTTTKAIDLPLITLMPLPFIRVRAIRLRPVLFSHTN